MKLRLRAGIERVRIDPTQLDQVILNLALFFGYHVLWPKGFAGSFDWISALIALAAAIALFRYKRSVIQVIAACAVLGLLIKTLL